MSGYDASHDYAHVFRVKTNAEIIAKREGLEGESQIVVKLAALMHDVRDHKYCSSDTASSEVITEFLTKHHVPTRIISRVCHVVDNVSFSKEIKAQKARAAAAAAGAEAVSVAGDQGMERGWHIDPADETECALAASELNCVQDADRLDAIGAIVKSQPTKPNPSKPWIQHPNIPNPGPWTISVTWKP
jgi:uncharacterized protein